MLIVAGYALVLAIEFALLGQVHGNDPTPKATPAQVAYYTDVFQKVRQLPEWKEFMETGAFKDTFMKGQEFQDWLLKAEVEHFRLMREAGFLAK